MNDLHSPYWNINFFLNLTGVPDEVDGSQWGDCTGLLISQATTFCFESTYLEISFAPFANDAVAAVST